ncbi:MAG: hypothetical protein Ct9H300mP1_20350 [Planctomycetaceae bacterium]|nr:MAG: hypothetical protein Ct9H300mP1_20350 [Planctomycetaceae bacterium]
MYYRGKQLSVVGRQLITNSHPEFYCYAESHDGIRWTKPDLGFVEFNGSKKNNIIWDGVGPTKFSPFLDKRPPGVRPIRNTRRLGGTMREGGARLRSPRPTAFAGGCSEEKPGDYQRSIRFPEPGILG